MAEDMSEAATSISDERGTAPGPAAGLLRAALDASAAPLIIVDEALVCRYMNPAAERVTGFTVAGEAALPLSDLILHSGHGGDGRTTGRGPLLRSLEGRRQERGEELLVHKDGTPYVAAYRATPLSEGAEGVGTLVEILASEGDSRAGEASFLLTLCDSLQGLERPDEMARTAGRLLAEHLGVEGFGYGELDGSEGTLPFSVFSGDTDGDSVEGRPSSIVLPRDAQRSLRQDLPYVLDDCASDDRLSPAERASFGKAAVRAAMFVPLFLAGRLFAAMVVHQRSPRRWRSDEVALLVEGAKRFREALERARMVGKLRDSEARYRALFESIDQGFYVSEVMLDEEGTPFDYRFLEMNPMFEKLTGIEDAVGKTAREAVPDLEAHWFDIYGRVALTGQPIRFVEKSEVLGRWFDVYAFRIGGSQSRTVAVLFTNITERKRAEEERDRLVKALEAERSQLATIFKEAPAAITTLRGPEHVFEMANPLYLELVGRRDIIGKTVRDALPEVADQGFFELLDGVFSSGRPFIGRGTRIVLQPEGGPQLERFLDFVYQPMRDAGGSITGIFVHAVDVTEHKRAEEALARAHDEMEQRVEERTAELRSLNAELESFNYSVSHDLRAPLRGIGGFSQVLLEEYGNALDDTARHYLERIQAGTVRMGVLIDALLDLSRLSRTPVVPQEVDLSDLARTVGNELREREPRNRSAVEIVVAEGMHALGDPVLLRIVLENLLENALKFTQNEGRGRVEVGASHRDGKAVYFVRDNGVGFSMQYADKLFVPFQRLHSAHEFTGTGVGLATVQRIVHKHGGRIWAEGAEGLGAVFYFTLGNASN